MFGSPKTHPRVLEHGAYSYKRGPVVGAQDATLFTFLRATPDPAYHVFGYSVPAFFAVATPAYSFQAVTQRLVAPTNQGIAVNQFVLTPAVSV